MAAAASTLGRIAAPRFAARTDCNSLLSNDEGEPPLSRAAREVIIGQMHRCLGTRVTGVSLCDPKVDEREHYTYEGYRTLLPPNFLG